MDKIQVRSNATKIFECILILLLGGLFIYFALLVSLMQGNGRVINYAGIVRGASQRLVKLEIAGEEHNELIYYLDNIFNDLQSEEGNYNLRKVNDQTYTESLKKQYEMWKQLKQEIFETRNKGYRNTNLMTVSEQYYLLADETVTAAERYSESIARSLRVTERILFVVMGLVMALLVKETVESVGLSRRNMELRKAVYIDAQTGLPNKGRCEEFLKEEKYLDPLRDYACAMFDLNNLKVVNDSHGHKAGDELIASFANLLRSSFPETVFVGRCGGDEFMAVFTDITEEQIKQYLQALDNKVSNYNRGENAFKISYAYGYEISTWYGECTMKNLMEMADKRMYHNKRKMKRKNGAEE